MKLFTPEISWHQKEPIFSVDFCPKTWKLASCGGDFTVKIWQVKEKADGDSIGIEFLANLDRHAKPVNVVRFSPDGKFLASAGDDGAIILWKLNDNEKCAPDIFGEEDVVNKESWVVHKMLRGHIEDVYDLAWSPDSTQLITGSVDNSAIIWDAVKGQNQKILTDHKHYVQGVCWDPRNNYLATHSSDRSCRLYACSNHKCLHNIHKNSMSYKKNGQVTKSKFSRMFMDETMQSFFRRCTFSPDGSFLFLPAGLCDGEEKLQKTTYVFARGRFSGPLRHLPGSKKATVAVKCSPISYELIDDKENLGPIKENNEFFKLPYRMVYAIASLDAVTFYDTQHDFPIGHCANMHYASLTDITWSSDGRLVVISSTDGYCSFVKFDDGELGTPISYDPIEYQVTQAKIRAAAKKESKRKDTKKADVEKLDLKSTEENDKKAVSTPKRNDEQKDKEKEKQSKGLDRNQPTIEKLFVTPVRKRKRLCEVSPSLLQNNKTISTPEAEASKTRASANSPSAVQYTGSRSNAASTILSPVTHKVAPKPPKRAQVITISTNDKPTSTSFSSALLSPPKPPKRVNVTTLATFPTAATTVESNTCRSQTPAVVKPPKRVAVTTLSFANSDDSVGASLSSGPSKPPNRVNVTTLSTLNGDNKIETKQLTSPKTTSSGTETKSPKRIQVTTLKAFSGALSNNTRPAGRTDNPCADISDANIQENTRTTPAPSLIPVEQTVSSEDRTTNQKEKIETIVID